MHFALESAIHKPDGFCDIVKPLRKYQVCSINSINRVTTEEIKSRVQSLSTYAF